ncbi:MAG TPA: dihydroorotate dehydrogenase electron transfer subunit [Thermoanaerobaculia bacterium]|jgi:dihydroorotate dehydrogenase electron transfer subunit
MIARDSIVEVVEVRAHPLPYFTLVLDGPRELVATDAGQFVMLETADGLEPYLRRAFSVADVVEHASSARLELLAKVVGRGTRAMAAARPRDRRRLLGPLGRGFTLPAAGPVALVAGGVGSAPLLLLGRRLVARGIAFDFYYGGRSAADLVRGDEFAALAAASGGRLVAATEDGSRGVPGRVTDALADELAAGARYRGLAACGPMPMLAALAPLAAAAGLAAEAALETEMGCGFGACLGCAVPHVAGRFALCCKDGPVFRLDEVRW